MMRVSDRLVNQKHFPAPVLLPPHILDPGYVTAGRSPEKP